MYYPHLLILENSVWLGLFVGVMHRTLIKAEHRMSHTGLVYCMIGVKCQCREWQL